MDVTSTNMFPTTVYALNGSDSFTLYHNVSGYYIMLNSNAFDNILILGGAHLINHSDMEYFVMNGIEYLAFIGRVPSSQPYTFLSFYDLTNGTYYYTNEQASSIQTLSTGELYYSVDNNVYEITDITLNTSNGRMDITTTIKYDIDITQTINDFKYDGVDMFIAADDGVYSTYDRACSTSTGIDTETITVVNFYPNPSNQYLNITNVKKNPLYKIYNQLGKVVLNGKVDQQINIENLTNGIYFLSIEGYSVKKFIKQ